MRYRGEMEAVGTRGIFHQRDARALVCAFAARGNQRESRSPTSRTASRPSFLRQNRKEVLVAKLPPDSPTALVRRLADLCSPGAREPFAAFFAPKVDAMRGGPLAYRQSLEAIDVCVASRVR